MDHWQRRFNRDNRRPAGRRRRPASQTPEGAAEQASAPILERFNYDAYGQQQTDVPAAAGEVGEKFDQLFQGMRIDPDAGMLDFHTRDFSPALQRWADQEPCGYVDGLNWYAAPVNEPVNPINPLGD